MFTYEHARKYAARSHYY